MPHVAARLTTLRGAFALLLILVVCAATAAPAMAVSGISSQGSAASAEYPPPKNTTTVEGVTTDGGNGNGDGIPFSGFATLMLAGMGLLTLSGGVTLWRAAREGH